MSVTGRTAKKGADSLLDKAVLEEGGVEAYLLRSSL
jgi:hypothetical protein